MPTDKNLKKIISTKDKIITHRGLEPFNSSFSYAESSYEAFQNHLARKFGGIEFDLTPTKDGFIAMHDTTLERITKGIDKRKISQITTDELRKISLNTGHIASFNDVMLLIKNHTSIMNALHLKSYLQTREMLEHFMETLHPYQNIFKKFILFDIKPKTAVVLKRYFPKLRLAPSVAHPYDIKRYNDSVGGTLIDLNQALRLADKGIINGIWADEWDSIGINKTYKKLYTPEFFTQAHQAGLFAVAVTPELHATSPGLYGGELHMDASNKNRLIKRIIEIKNAGADYVCTDYPEDVARI